LFICNFYSLGVDDRVKADKRKSGESKHCDEVTKKKQKRNNVDTSKNKDVKAEKKSRSHKGEQFFLPKFAFRTPRGSFLSKNNFHIAHV